MLTVSSGHSPVYLLKEVATGRENYCTGAVVEGEPPGRWWGRGAEQLGLSGLEDPQDMRAVFERFRDPATPTSATRSAGMRRRRSGTPGGSSDRGRAVNGMLERVLNAGPERRAELRVEAGKQARQNVAFLDVTFSVQKSVTLLHTGFEAEQPRPYSRRRLFLVLG